MGRAGIVVTLVCGALASAYGALVLLDLLARHEVRATRALSLPAGGGLALDTGSGDVTVTAGSGPPQLVAVAQRGLFGGGELRIERDASGRLGIDQDCGFLGLSCGGTLDAVVPARLDVRLQAGSGDVAVRGMRGSVTAEAGSGTIRLDDVAGAAVLAETGSGDIEGGGVAAARLRAETGSGDVDLRISRAPEETSVATGSGTVTLRVPDVVYDLSAETGSGDQDVGVRSATGAPRRLRVRTGSGDVDVRSGP